MKKRDRQMAVFMEKQRRILEHITDEKDRIAYFNKTVLPKMAALEKKEQRAWDDNRADFDLDVLERGYDSESDASAIPERLTESLVRADLDDIVFSKDPADIHHLVTDRGLCYLLKQLTDRQKELLFHMSVHGVDGAEIADAEGVNIRNITSVHKRTLDHLRTQMLPLILLKFKLEHSDKWHSMARERFIYTIYEERSFCAEMGRDYLEYWQHSYFEGINFNLTPITDHNKAEPKRKRIRVRKKKDGG